LQAFLTELLTARADPVGNIASGTTTTLINQAAAVMLVLENVFEVIQVMERTFQRAR